MIAGRACGHNIRPDMLPAQVFGQDVIDCQGGVVTAPVLAGIIIASKDFASSQFHAWTWPVDHVFKADNGRPRQ
jgi:hypothetical protein